MSVHSVQSVKVYADVPERVSRRVGCARHTTEENIDAAGLFNTGRLTPQAVFVCLDSSVGQGDIDIAIGWHPTRHYSE